MDSITIKDLLVKGQLGPDHWTRGRTQVLILNITGFIDFATTDEISKTVSYSLIATHVQSFIESQTSLKTLEAIGARLALDCLGFGLEKVQIRIEKANALLHADTAGLQITRTKADIPFLEAYCGGVYTISPPTPTTEDAIFIKNLGLSCIIGVNAFEKVEKQRVVICIKLHFLPSLLDPKASVPAKNNYRTIAHKVSVFVEKCRYETLEMMVNEVCNVVLYECNVDKVTISIDKPSAITFASSAGVLVTRSRLSTPPHKLNSDKIIAYIAIGTNMGKRVDFIAKAMKGLAARGIIVIDTGFLYETSPMYVLDQPMFLNSAIKVETILSPLDLLAALKDIEAELGRDFHSLRNGPRVIDLDILFYGNIEFHNEVLTIPHPRIQERFFVLEPLADIAPDYYHPTLFRTVIQMLKILRQSDVAKDPMHKVMPIRDTVWNFNARTIIMGILNVTPDSFSDGGRSETVEAAVTNAMQMIKDGADIIDVGGQSTAPDTPEITAEEEIKRVVPAIKAIRALNTTIPISVDTFRASVAKAAIQAGADLVNDVSGGSRDVEMLSVMAEARVPVCLMHMRGNSVTMQKLTDYKGDVMTIMRGELGATTRKAILAGMYRWHISIDPGFGFAKDQRQNFEILKRLSELNKPESGSLSGMPILVGVSRKGFIGKTTNQPVAANRVYGTAAATAISILGGANIIRCHDVKEMKDVCLISDQSLRSGSE